MWVTLCVNGIACEKSNPLHSRFLDVTQRLLGEGGKLRDISKKRHGGRQVNSDVDTCAINGFPCFMFQGPASVPVTAREVERFNDRSYGFSEQVGHWDLPMHEGGVALDVAVGPGKEFSYTLYCNSIKA